MTEVITKEVEIDSVRTCVDGRGLGISVIIRGFRFDRFGPSANLKIVYWWKDEAGNYVVPNEAEQIESIFLAHVLPNLKEILQLTYSH